MFIFSFKSKNLLSLTILATVVICFIASINGRAQILPGMQSENFEAVDPLLFDVRNYPPNNNASFNEALTSSSFINKKEHFMPTEGALDLSLNAEIDFFPGSARSSAIQPDGKILIGGYFKTINGIRSDSIVRLNVDNSIDRTFSPSINGTVFAIVLQSDGKIVVGGSFTVVNGTNQNRIARLNVDGSLDSSFNTVYGANNVVYDVAIQPDGKILVAGSFNFVGTSSNPHIARLNLDGSVDTSFTSVIPRWQPSFIPSIIYSIALQSDGKIILGGLIILDAASPNQTTPIVRLNANGSLDTSFSPGTINSNLFKVVVQPDGKILIGGFFSSINGINRRYLARLNADGSLDNSFNADAAVGAPVQTFYLKPDGKILVGSLIVPSNGVVRQLNVDGSLDQTFVPNEIVLGRIYTIISTAGGKILTGGAFASASGESPSTALLFDSDGSPDASFNFSSTALGGVSVVVAQPDGKIIIGGNFNRINGTGKSYLARLNTDGSIDNTFNTDSFSAVQISTLLLQPDGKILVGGTNIIIGAGTAPSLVRLNPDGSFDNSFTQGNIPGIRAANTIALQSDGKILFSYLSAPSNSVGLGGLARLNADGSIDTTFSSNVNISFEAIIALPDGKILVGGSFSIGYVNSGTGTNDTYPGIIWLNEDGTHDRTFRAGFAPDTERFSSVYALARQADGKILAGGILFTGDAVNPVGVVRLNPSGTIDGTFQLNQISSSTEFARVEDLQLIPNGKILLGGRFNNFGGVTNANIARLNANGLIDETFSAVTNNTVFDVALQNDGNVLIGGIFDSVNGTARTSLARLESEPVISRRTLFDFDGDGKSDISVFRPDNGTWYLNQSQSGFTGIRFGIATDKLVPADYDGDDKADVAVFRDGYWYLLRSRDGFAALSFGLAEDIPQPADYDGDGKAELAVYRPSAGSWYVLNLVDNQFSAVQFGISADTPVIGDYDSDGKADYAVYRPENGIWYLLQSTAGFAAVRFGISTDKPVPADYDGDGKTDIAVYREGIWYLLQSMKGFAGFQFGIATDIPTPADYDGDGKADAAVFRNGSWYLLQSTNGFTAVQFGVSQDKPVPNAFVR